jgi:hypothetical protein
MSDVETFLRLVSLPDVAVYIRQPESVLISRTSKRGHKRIPENSSALVNQFIKHGLAVFDKLAECSSLEGKLLTVNGGESIKPVQVHPSDPRLEYVRKIIAFETNAVSGDPYSVEEVN